MKPLKLDKKLTLKKLTVSNLSNVMGGTRNTGPSACHEVPTCVTCQTWCEEVPTCATCATGCDEVPTCDTCSPSWCC